MGRGGNPTENLLYGTVPSSNQKEPNQEMHKLSWQLANTRYIRKKYNKEEPAAKNAVHLDKYSGLLITLPAENSDPERYVQIVPAKMVKADDDQLTFIETGENRPVRENEHCLITSREADAILDRQSKEELFANSTLATINYQKTRQLVVIINYQQTLELKINEHSFSILEEYEEK